MEGKGGGGARDATHLGPLFACRLLVLLDALEFLPCDVEVCRTVFLAALQPSDFGL